MRIDELIGYREHPAYRAAQQLGREASSADHENAAQNFIRRITDLGYHLEHIGSGLFANVFVRPNDPYVIKIFVRDPSYLKYVKYCLKNQDNPHVPRLRGGLIPLGNGTYAVRIERLEPWKPDHSNHEVAMIGHELTTGFKTFIEHARNSTIEEYSSDLHRLFQDLSDIFGKGHPADLNQTNIMVRNGNTIVITDPVV